MNLGGRSTSGFNIDALRRGIEQCDVRSLTDLYADDAQLRIVNRNSTPSSPRELHGREEISRYFQDICGRDMTHHVEQEVVSQDRAAFLDACRYQDGTRVLSSNVVELESGKIKRQVGVEAWDGIIAVGNRRPRGSGCRDRR